MAARKRHLRDFASPFIRILWVVANATELARIERTLAARKRTCGDFASPFITMPLGGGLMPLKWREMGRPMAATKTALAVTLLPHS